jgi:hypothetical protein
MPNGANISEARLTECIVSARFWANHLNSYSDKMQALADGYAISASLISTITGLAVWGMIAASPKLWAQVLVGAMAFAAAAVAVVPKVKGYGECAVKAAPLSTEYGKVLGDLEDALTELQSHNPSAQTDSRAAVDAFQVVKAKKDALKPFPRRLEEEISTRGLVP